MAIRWSHQFGGQTNSELNPVTQNYLGALDSASDNDNDGWTGDYQRAIDDLGLLIDGEGSADVSALYNRGIAYEKAGGGTRC